MLQPQTQLKSLLLFRQNAFKITSVAPCRTFWSKTADKEEEAQGADKKGAVEEIDDSEEKKSSFVETNIGKNMHKRFIPREKLKFNISTPEGKVALVFHNTESPASDKRFQMFAGLTIPALVAGSQFVPAPFLTYFYPALLIPNVYFFFANYLTSRRLLNTEVEKAWLFQSGKQMLLQTHNGKLHKINIMGSEEYDHSMTYGDGTPIFVINNQLRRYHFVSRNCELIDYALLTAITQGITVDTSRIQSLYHRLISRPLPANLKPSEFTRHLPSADFPSFNSNCFIWRYKNRTIYRSKEFEGADADFLFWLRNRSHKSKLNEAELALRQEFGLKHVLPSKLFYETHKISQENLLEKLREAREKKGGDKKVEKIISGLFDDEARVGRRGVKTTAESVQIVKKKILKKEKARKFVNKVSGYQEGMNYAQIRESGFFRSDMLY